MVVILSAIKKRIRIDMRITRKKENGFYKLKEGQEIYGEEDGIRLVQIVGRFEDIEDELGIDLLTLFKALKNGVYYFTRGMQLTKDYVGLIDDYISIGPRDKLSYSLMTGFEKQTLSVKDYGKTRALTKEELL